MGSDKHAQAEQEIMRLSDAPDFSLLPSKVLSFLYNQDTQIKELEEHIIKRKREKDPDW